MDGKVGTETAFELMPQCLTPESEIILPIAGTWRIPRKLSHWLSAMYRTAHGTTPSQNEINSYVSSLLESQIATFRLAHRAELAPRRQPADPTREIKEVCE
jgi:hypothetical protein